MVKPLEYGLSENLIVPLSPKPNEKQNNRMVGKIEFEHLPVNFLRDLKIKMRRSENTIPKVFICIRLRPKSKNPVKAKQEFRHNLKRAKITARYAVLSGFDPEATTIYFTQFLNDSLVKERELGIKIGQIRLVNCNKLWVVLDKNEVPSSGMASDIKVAEENGIRIERKHFFEIKSWVKKYEKTSQ